MAEIDNLSIAITASADEAVNGINRIASACGRLTGSTRTAAGGMRAVSSDTETASSRLERVSRDASVAGANVRRFGREVNESAKSVKHGTNALTNFWRSLTRIAYYRFIRTVIKDMGQSFRDLYGYSKAFGTQFSTSMDSLTTSTTYLRNSIAAMAAPLIDMFAPALDFIIDKAVVLLNVFNRLFAAISGAETYTVAKKFEREWSDTFDTAQKKVKKTTDEFKRTILGFDEINKLSKEKTSSTGGTGSSPYTEGYKLMFEGKPLEGFLKQVSDVTRGWPDWLKWLLGIGGAAGVAWGLKQIPNLLNTIWDLLRKLFTITIPDWFKWLFGPKGGDDTPGFNIPKEIDLPEAELPVNLTEGDFSVLDDLKKQSVLVPVGLKHWGWDNIRDWIGPVVTIAIGIKRWGWDNLKDWIGDPVYVRVGLQHWGWDNINDWIGTAVTVAVGLRRWGWKTLSNWMGADKGVYTKVGLRHWGWDNIENWIGTAVTVAVALKKWQWTTLENWTGADKVITAKIALRKYEWTTMTHFLDLDRIHEAFIALRKSGWDTIQGFVGTSVSVAIILFRYGWSTISDFVGNFVDVYVYLRPGNFTHINYWTGDTIFAYVYLKKGNFKSLSDWLGNKVDVYVNLKQGSGYGGSSGGGGSTGGGGAGRGRRESGGIFNSNFGWRNLPAFANGGNNIHGTMFLAGEAGPEVVGHVGSTTEVLNKSQLASAMYSAVRAAMAPASSNFASAAAYMQNDSMAYENENMSLLMELVRRGSDATERQTDLMVQQNDYLRQINDKEFSAEITTSSVNRAMQRTNRRAGTTIVAIG